MDLKNHKIIRATKYEDFYAPISGTSIEKTCIYLKNNTVFTSARQLISYLQTLDIFLDPDSLLYKNFNKIKVKKPHFNNNENIRIFREKIMVYYRLILVYNVLN